MATNQITIVIEDCEPIGGYYVFYRPIGSVDPFRFAGIFFSGPIVFTNEFDPPNQEYEGYIQSHCGGGIFGDQIPWETSGSPSVSGGSEPECCDPTIITGTATTIIPDGSLSGSGSEPEVCCTPFILSACIETIAESGSESDSGSEPPPDTNGIMHLFSAESYAIMELKDLAYWNTRYSTGTNAATPFDEILLYPDDLKIVLKGATGLIMDNVWEDFQEEALGLKGFWDNSGSVIQVNGSFAFNTSLEVVELLYTPSFLNNCFLGCTALLSVIASVVTELGILTFQDCDAIQTITLPACTDLGGTTGDDNVFLGLTGATITLTIPTATATDGDVVTLQANNTVTLILV